MLEVRPGRWHMQCGKTVVIEDREGKSHYPWRGVDDGGVRHSWKDNGAWFHSSHPSPFDLVEYLGPEKPTGGDL